VRSKSPSPAPATVGHEKHGDVSVKDSLPSEKKSTSPSATPGREKKKKNEKRIDKKTSLVCCVYFPLVTLKFLSVAFGCRN